MTESKKLVYGLTGLGQLLNCSHATSQRIKNECLSGCYSQFNRTIVFNVDLVLERLGMQKAA